MARGGDLEEHGAGQAHRSQHIRECIRSHRVSAGREDIGSDAREWPPEFRTGCQAMRTASHSLRAATRIGSRPDAQRNEVDNGDIQRRMFLRDRSNRSLRQARRHGLLPLPIVPFVVGRSGQRIHALEARRGADHGRCRAGRHVQQDAGQRAAILQEMRRSPDDQSSSVWRWSTCSRPPCPS